MKSQEFWDHFTKFAIEIYFSLFITLLFIQELYLTDSNIKNLAIWWSDNDSEWEILEF